MNLILWIIDAVAGFVKRNPILCLVILILAVGAPSLLAGIASIILYAILALFVIMFLMSLVFRWKIAKLSSDFQQQARHQNQQYGQNNNREGDVEVHINNPQTGKRFSDNVGDYVDFEEEKNQ